MVKWQRCRKNSRRKLYEDSSEENESKDICVMEEDHHKSAFLVKDEQSKQPCDWN
jgi:hypothetical protein